MSLARSLALDSIYISFAFASAFSFPFLTAMR